MSVPHLYVHRFREILLSVDVVESTVFDLSVADRMFGQPEYSISGIVLHPGRGVDFKFPFERQFNLSYTDSRNGK